MGPADVWPKHTLQQRLLLTAPRTGPRKLTPELRLRDIAGWLGVKLLVLSACAHKRQEVDDSLQLQLSAFFQQWDRGLLVKVLEGGQYVIKRVAPPPPAQQPPRATIRWQDSRPRIDWSKR